MNDKSLQTLEYNKIKDMLVNLASSDMGQALCRDLNPINNIDEILQAHPFGAEDALRRLEILERHHNAEHGHIVEDQNQH